MDDGQTGCSDQSITVSGLRGPDGQLWFEPKVEHEKFEAAG
jgi:hypothetical protein